MLNKKLLKEKLKPLDKDITSFIIHFFCFYIIFQAISYIYSIPSISSPTLWAPSFLEYLFNLNLLSLFFASILTLFIYNKIWKAILCLLGSFGLITLVTSLLCRGECYYMFGVMVAWLYSPIIILGGIILSAIYKIVYKSSIKIKIPLAIIFFLTLFILVIVTHSSAVIQKTNYDLEQQKINEDWAAKESKRDTIAKDIIALKDYQKISDYCRTQEDSWISPCYSIAIQLSENLKEEPLNITRGQVLIMCENIEPGDSTCFGLLP